MINEPTPEIQAQNLQEFEAAEIKPRYECNRNGVFYIGVETDKDGKAHEKPPIRLSDPINLIGNGIDGAGNHYRIIEWRDNISRKRLTAALPMAEIGTNWGRLQSLGLAVMANRRKRELLADYLQTDGSHTPYSITAQSGWIKRPRAYVLPNGQIIVSEAYKSRVRAIYNGDKSQAAAYNEAGTLADWQKEVAVYAAGNSRLSLAIGAALSAPLLYLLGMESGGFHLFGDSRDGKSTAARAALSVWGSPAELMASWTGTSHGFNNLANSRNDGFLVLDEIGQANPRHVSQTAYSVINGISKIQGAKDGGNREATRWRIMLLSTGEKNLDGFLQTAKAEWNAGQAARLPSIPSDAGKGLGIFDTLHGHQKGSHLAESINQAASRNYGHAGRAFVELMLIKPAALSEARQLIADFMAALPDMDGQARTVAIRFAAVAAALELAARHGITGIAAGLAFPAIKQCFDSWFERNGTGKFEDRKIIENAINFAQRNFDSQRFVILPNPPSFPVPHDLAGYRKKGEQPENDCFYILPAVFSDEICKDFDKAKVCDVLHNAQWLQYNKAGCRWQHQLKGKGRFFLICGTLPPHEMGE
ncbi:DUF927 domain-containing protein [Neisseria dentiae]|uniref:DUF927 domain-containing protein n=2 Tax=Neisseria dentiae TaxID=194197 RepID=UPI0035A0A12F